MRFWPEYGFGLVVPDDASITAIINGYNAIHPDDELEDAYELVECMDGADNLWRLYTNDDCDGMTVRLFSGKEIYVDECLVVYAQKESTPFNAPYRDIEELKEELKKAVGQYLPADFDWDTHLGWFSCSICC